MSLAGLAFFGQSDEQRKRLVWSKGRVIPGYDPAVWRHDAFGRVMRYADHGDRNSTHGWEIDHIHPRSLGGSDHIDNLRPLHCTNNIALGTILGQALR